MSHLAAVTLALLSGNVRPIGLNERTITPAIEAALSIQNANSPALYSVVVTPTPLGTGNDEEGQFAAYGIPTANWADLARVTVDTRQYKYRLTEITATTATIRIYGVMTAAPATGVMRLWYIYNKSVLPNTPPNGGIASTTKTWGNHEIASIALIAAGVYLAQQAQTEPNTSHRRQLAAEKQELLEIGLNALATTKYLINTEPQTT